MSLFKASRSDAAHPYVRDARGRRRPEDVGRSRLARATAFALEKLEARTMLAATPLYWDPAGASTASGGAGTWNTTTAQWRSGSATGPLVAWSNGGDANGPYQAVFPASGGTVTIGVGVTASSVSFTASGYSLSGGNAITLAGTTGQVDVASGATETIAAPVAGTVGLTKTSAGKLTLSGNNNYTGGTTLSSGTLDVTSDAALGAVPSSVATNVTFSGTATLQAGASSVSLAAQRGVSIAAGVTATLDTQANTLTVSGPISNVDATGVLAKGGTGGTLVLAGSDSFAGGTTVQLGGGTNVGAGTLKLASSGALGTNAITIDAHNVTNNAAATLSLAGGVTVGSNVTYLVGGHQPGYNVDLDSAGGNNAFNGTFTLANTGGNYAIQSTSGTLTVGGPVNLGFTAPSARQLLFQGAGAGVIAGLVSGNIAPTFAGPGTWTVNTGQTYTGATTVGGGTLSLNVNQPLYGTLYGTQAGGTITVNSGGTLLANNINSIAGYGDSQTSVVVNAGGKLTNQTGYTNQLVSLTLAGGTLAVAPGSTRYGGFEAPSGAVFSATASSAITGSGLTMDPGSSFTVSAGATLSVAGALANTSLTTGVLTKNGPGTMVVAGVNAYGGATSVNAGTLQVDGSVGSGAVTVASGATLSGTGTVPGPVTVGGTLSPGDGAATGVLNTGALTFQPGSILAAVLNGSTPGTGYGQVNVTGNASFGNATLALSGSRPHHAGDPLVLVRLTSPGQSVGGFTGLPQGGTVTVGGVAYQATYVSGSNGAGTGSSFSLVDGNPTTATTLHATAQNVSAVRGVAGAYTVATFTDGPQGAGPYSASVVIGSAAAVAGSVTAIGGNWVVKVPGPFVESGLLPVAVTISSATSGSVTVSATATVTNPQLTLAGGLSVSTSGDGLNSALVATVSDPAGTQPLSHYAGTIDYGDGTTGPAVLSYDTASGGIDVIANHLYADGGAASYTVTVSVTEDGIASAPASVTSTVTIAAPTAPPPAPLNVAAEALSGTEVYVRWVDESGVATNGYEIQRSVSGGPFTDLIGLPQGETAYLDHGLTTSTAYQYRVLGVNPYGRSPAPTMDAAATTTSLDTTGTYQVISVGATVAGRAGAPAVTGGLVLSNANWIVAGSAMGAMLHAVSGTLTVSTSGRTYTAGTSGAFRVTPDGFTFDDSYGLAGDDLAYGDDLVPVTVALSPVPLVPVGTTAATASKSQITIAWQPPAGPADGYNVYHRQEPGGAWERLNPGATTTVTAGTTSFTDTGLEAGTQYSYEVTAVHHGVESDRSDPIPQTTFVAKLTDAVVCAAFSQVYNSVAVELYAGAMKGWEGTQDTGRGNDWDQALLLQHLLLQAQGPSSSPAQIVHGQINATVPSLRGWLGLSDQVTPAAIVGMLATAGLNPTIGADGKTIAFDHTWVQATTSDGGTVQLDPSWKQTQVLAGVGGAIAADSSDPVQDPALLGTSDTPFEYYEQQLSAWLSPQGKGLADVTNRGQIVRESFTALPDGPPGPGQVTLPQNSGYNILSGAAAVSGDADGTPDLTATGAAAVFTHRVRISVLRHDGTPVFVGAVLTLPTASTQMTTVYVDGTGQVHLVTEDVASGATVDTALGSLNGSSNFTVQVEHFDPGFGTAYNDPAATAASPEYHVYSYVRNPTDWVTVGVNADQVSDALIASLQGRMNQLANAENYSAAHPMSDPLANTLRRQAMEMAALTYFRDLNEQRDLLAGQLHVLPIWTRPESGVVTGSDVAVDGVATGVIQRWNAGLQNPVQPARMHLDDQNVGGGTDVSAGDPTSPAVIMASVDPSNAPTLPEIDEVLDTNAAALEGTSLEAMTGSSAMSTIRGFQWAAQQESGGPVVITIPGGDASSPSLRSSSSPLPAAYVAGLTDGQVTALDAAHRAGYLLILPAERIQILSATESFPSWTGMVWVQQKWLPALGVWDRAFVVDRTNGAGSDVGLPEYGGDTIGDQPTTLPAATTTPTAVTPPASAGQAFNPANGVATRDETDFTAPNVMPVAFTRHYASVFDPSRDANVESKLNDAGMGVGWSFAYSDFLHFNYVNSSGTQVVNSVVWVAGDGTRRTFTYNPVGDGSYISPSGDGGVMWALPGTDGSGRDRLAYRGADGTIYIFSHPDPSSVPYTVDHARLDRIEDPNGNELIFTYNPYVYQDGYDKSSDPLDQLETIESATNPSPQDIRFTSDTTPQNVTTVVTFAYYQSTDTAPGQAPAHVRYVSAMGQTWTYTYTHVGDRVYLASVTCPPVASSVNATGGAQGNQVYSTSYTYYGPDPADGAETNLQGLLDTVTQSGDANSTNAFFTRTYSYYANRRVFSVQDTATSQAPAAGAAYQAQLPPTQYASYDIRAGSARTDDADGNATVTTFTPDGHTESIRLADGSTSTQNWGGIDDVGIFVATSTAGTDAQFKTDHSGVDVPFNVKTDGVVKFGQVQDTPLAGDWTGDGTDNVGVFHASESGPGLFQLDTNGDNRLDGAELAGTSFGPAISGITLQPVVGDWNGLGRDEIGVFWSAGGTDNFILDNNGAEVSLSFTGAQTGDKPIAGDWNGDGITDVGVMRDVNGMDDFVLWLTTAPLAGPYVDFTFGAAHDGDQPVAGYFSPDNVSDVGVFRNVDTGDGNYAARFTLDTDGNRRLDLGDAGYTDETAFLFKAEDNPDAQPVVGNWSGDGSRDQLRSTTDAIGRTTVYRYDSAGQVIDQLLVDPNATILNNLGHEGLETVISYDPLQSSDLHVPVDPRYAAQSTTYYVATAVDPDEPGDPFEKVGQSTVEGTASSPNLVTSYGYDGQGNVLWSQDANQDTTLMTYDGYGRLATLTKPNGVAFNNGAPIHTMSGGHITTQFTTTYTYAEIGAIQTDLALTQVSGADGSEVVNTYDYTGHLASTTDGTVSDDGTPRTTYYQYSGLGQLLRKWVPNPDGDPNSFFTTYNTYGDNGLLWYSINAIGQESSFQYDPLGRPISTTAFGASSPKITRYDAVGNVVETQDEMGNATFFYYDDRNRLVQTVNADGSWTALQLDGVGRAVGKLDQDGRQTTDTYDDRDRLLSETLPDPDGAGPLAAPQTTYVYNYLGVVSKTEANGARTTYYRLDNLGRTIYTLSPGQYQTASGQPELLLTSTAYDADGNVHTTTVYDSTARDVAGDGWVDFPSVDATNLSTVPSHTTTYSYDGLDRKSSETDADPDGAGPLAAPVTLYGYDTSGNLVGVVAADGSETASEYDSLNRVVGTGADKRPATVAILGPTTIGVTLASDHGLQTGDLVLVRGAFSLSGPWDGVFAVTVTGPNSFTYSPAAVPNAPTDTSAYVFLSATATAYDPVGNVYTRTDGRGNTTTFLYSGQNWRSTEIDPNPAGSGQSQGPTTTWTYDAVGNLKTTTDPLGNLPGANAALHTTTYTYDSMNRRTSTTLPDADGSSGTADSAQTVMSYTATGQLETTTDPLGNVAFNVYDADGRTVLAADGGEWGTITNVSGDVITISLLGHGLSGGAKVVVGAGPKWLADGAASGGYSVTVVDLNTITISLSQSPDAVTAQLAVGDMLAVSKFFTSTTYNLLGQVTSTTDRNGNVTTDTYDAAGDMLTSTLVSATIPGEVTETGYTYDSFGNLWTVTSPDGYVLVGGVNVPGPDAANYRTTYTYDALNRKVSQTIADADGMGHPAITLYQYDPLGRLTSTDASGVVALTSYDALGRPAMTATGGRGDAVLKGSVSDPNSNFTVTVTLHNHGLATGDRVFVRGADNEYLGIQTVTVVDADTFTFVASSALAAAGESAVVSATSVATAYDADGNVVSTTDGRGNTTTYQYDALNRKVAELQPIPDGVQAAPETSYAYDFNGNLIAMQSPDGNAASGGEPAQAQYLTTYAYDDDNRRIAQSAPSIGTANGLVHPVTDYGYDLDGNLATVADPRGSITSYRYDRLNRKVREQDAHAGSDDPVDDDPVTTWAYDGNGNVLSETSPLGNQPGANAAAYTTNYAYTDLNKVLVEVQPDPDGSGSTALAAQVITRYVYDAAGNVTSVTDPLGNVTTYGYDGLGRQTSEQQPDPNGDPAVTNAPLTESTYDVFGDLTSTTDTSPAAMPSLTQTTATVYDSLHRPIFTGSDVHTGTASSSATSVTVSLNVAVTNPAIAVNEYVLAFGPAGTADPICGIYLVTGVSGSSVTFSVPDLTLTVMNEPISLGRSPTAKTYDADGNVTSTTDALGYQTTYEYDALNRKVKQTLPDPDPANDPAGIAAPVTTYQYDPSGRLIATVDPIGNQSTDGGVQDLHRTGYVYDPAGDKVNEIDGAHLIVAGDGTVTPVQATTASPITGYGYDLNGNLVSVEKFSAAGPELTNYAYDNLNRKVAQTLPSASTGLPGGSDAAQTLYTYDVAGNLLTTVDPRGTVPGAVAANFTTTYTYDALNRKLSVSVADADAAGDAAITTYQYDHNGNLIATTDPLGNLPGGTAAAHTTTYQYDALNRKVAEIDPPANPGDANQPTTRWGYDVFGNTVWMIDPLGNQGLGVSPAASTLSALVAAHHDATTYVYDDLNRKVAEVDPHASDTPADDSDVPVTTFGYNAAGEMVWTTSPDGNQLDGLNPYVPGTNHTTYYQYDQLGQKVSESDPSPNVADGPQQPSVTRYGYDANGNLIYTIDPLANVVPDASPSPSAFAAITNDVANHLNTTVTVYDNLNRKMADYQADADGNPATTADRPVTSYTYDQLGNLLTQTDPAGNVTTNVYYLDNTLHTATTLATVNTSVANVTRTYTYDVDGNVHTEVDRDGHGTTYTYDPLDRVTNEVQTAAGIAPEVTVSAYDVAGRLTSTSDNSSSYVYRYDSLGRVVETDSQTSAMTGRLPLGPNVTPAILSPTLSYFNNGQDVPAGDYVITYVSGTLQFGPGQGYDIIDRDAHGYSISFGGGTVAFPATYIDGATTAQSESANAGRSITVHHTGGKIGIYIQDSPYSDNVAGSDGAPTFKLTAASGLTAGAAPVVYFYAYDVAGRKESATATVYGVTDHTELYHFDDLDRNDGVTQEAAGTPNLTLASTYDNEGQLLTEQRYSGSTPVMHSVYQYDDAGRLYSLTHTNGGTGGGSTIDAYSFAFDLEGWMVQFQSTADGTATYAYDGNGQLTGSTGSAAAAGSEQYAYDANGNRTTATSAPGQASGSTQTYAVGKDNRVTAAGGDRFTYDAEGNRTGETVTGTAAQTDQLGYDARDRLVSDAMTTTAGTLAGQLVSAAYQYDVDDRRVGKTVSTTAHPSASGTPDSIVSERYAYDGDQLSMVLTPAAAGTAAAAASPPQAVVSTRVFGTPGSTDRPIATVDTTTGIVTWLLGDDQGSIRDAVASNGTTTHVKYDAYGNVIGTTVPQRFGYTGQVYDAETGLTYMNARYYDPGTGDFVSQDPSASGGGDANLYRYVGNSTPNGTDPTGESVHHPRTKRQVQNTQQNADSDYVFATGGEPGDLFGSMAGSGVVLDPNNQGGFVSSANGIGLIGSVGGYQPGPTSGLSPEPVTDPYATGQFTTSYFYGGPPQPDSYIGDGSAYVPAYQDFGENPYAPDLHDPLDAYYTTMGDDYANDESDREDPSVEAAGPSDDGQGFGESGGGDSFDDGYDSGPSDDGQGFGERQGGESGGSFGPQIKVVADHPDLVNVRTRQQVAAETRQELASSGGDLESVYNAKVAYYAGRGITVYGTLDQAEAAQRALIKLQIFQDAGQAANDHADEVYDNTFDQAVGDNTVRRVEAIGSAAQQIGYTVADVANDAVFDYTFYNRYVMSGFTDTSGGISFYNGHLSNLEQQIDSGAVDPLSLKYAGMAAENVANGVTFGTYGEVKATVQYLNGDLTDDQYGDQLAVGAFTNFLSAATLPAEANVNLSVSSLAGGSEAAIGQVPGLATRAIPRILTEEQLNGLLGGLKKLDPGAMLKLSETGENSAGLTQYGRAFVKFGTDVDATPAGVGFEEFQHAFDALADPADFLAKAQLHPLSVENYLYHADVFERAAANPLFKEVGGMTEAEQASLLSAAERLRIMGKANGG